MSYDVLQSMERWLDVVLTLQANGIDPVTNAAYTDLIVKYRKEGDTTATTKTMAAADWRALDSGVYRIRFSDTELNTLGSFTYSVELAAVYTCSEFVPYYGHVEVVGSTVTTIGNDLGNVEDKIDGIDGKIGLIQTDVTTIEGTTNTILSEVLAIEAGEQNEVGVGAYYDDSTSVLTVSLVLHNNGQVVALPLSSSVNVYDQDGALLVSDMSSSSDAQGVFKYDLSVALITGTIPYVEAEVTNATGESFTTVVTMPVVQ